MNFLVSLKEELSCIFGPRVSSGVEKLEAELQKGDLEIARYPSIPPTLRECLPVQQTSSGVQSSIQNTIGCHTAQQTSSGVQSSIQNTIGCHTAQQSLPTYPAYPPYPA